MYLFLERRRSLAVLFVVCALIASCTLPDNLLNEDPSSEQSYTLCILANKSDSPQTRALGFEGNALIATWTEGDPVSVLKGDESLGTLTATDISDDGLSCKLTGQLTQAPAVGDVLTLTSQGPDYLNQDGTLAYIAAHCDFAKATITVQSVSENREISATSASFINQQSIVKFTMTDKADGTRKLSPSQINISAKAIVVDLAYNLIVAAPVFSNSLTIPSSTYQTNGEGVIYLAIPNIQEELAPLKPNMTLSITGTVGNDSYSVTKSGYPFGDGKYYTIQVLARKRKIVNLSNLTKSYVAQDGETLTGTSPNTYKISIADGATITLSDATINGKDNDKCAGLSCVGDATIILESGTANYIIGNRDYYPGIHIPEDKTLTILGSGTLDVTSKHAGCPAIGSGGYTSGPNGGNIQIDGGIIYTHTTSYAPGIGSGSSKTVGNITINGGYIQVQGGIIAPGIGAAGGATCGDITINGGYIFAQGGLYGAGIGSGQGSRTQNSVCGNITINGGFVSASSGTTTSDMHHGGAGIGSGYNGSECGNILIQGGRVMAVGAYGAAGIGAGQGFNETQYSTCGDITIRGGNVIAETGADIGTGEHGGAGIGSGSLYSRAGKILIEGGSVYATGALGGAGIGSGDTAYCDNITITGGMTKVSAWRGDSAPYCIGPGLSSVSCGTVAIGGVTGPVTTSDPADPYVYPAE